jgi:hypothetical protein
MPGAIVLLLLGSVAVKALRITISVFRHNFKIDYLAPD